MRNTLNDITEKYIKNTKLEKISYNSIKEAYKNIPSNNYGTLAHHLINFKYNNKKVLKMLDELFCNGLDINAKGSATGYTFLHLAFYGYTDESDQEISYSEEFIFELIDLAKKYNFNFNLQDNDGDTIMHSCIASEIYEGKIIPVLNKVIDVMDINIKNKLNDNIYDALIRYKKEAQKNSLWYNRLTEAETELKDIIEQKNININELENTIKGTINNILIEIKNIKIDNIIEVTDNIDSLLIKLNQMVNLREKYYKRSNFQDYNILCSKYQDSIIDIVNTELDELQKNPNKNIIDKLETIINKYSLSKQKNKLTKIKKLYEEYIKNVIDKISENNTLNLIISVLNNELVEDDNLAEKINELTEIKNNMLDTITSINYKEEKINIIKKLIHQDIPEPEDYYNITLDELNKINNEKEDELNFLIESIKEFINILIENNIIDIKTFSPKKKKKQ